jgi:hypothetical protein
MVRVGSSWFTASGNAVQELDDAGVFVRQATHPFGHYYYGITFDGGYLWVCGRVEGPSPADSFVRQIDPTDLSTVATYTIAVADAFDVAFRAGTLYVLFSPWGQDVHLVEVTLAGVVLGAIALPPQVAGRDLCMGMDFDGSYLWISDYEPLPDDPDGLATPIWKLAWL